VVEGVEVYPKPGYDYTAVDEWGKESKYFYNWWEEILRGVRDYPIDLGKHQKQLVYSPHDYGPLVHKQPWFYEGFNKETLYNDCWRDNWAYIHEENIAPLIVGEWGGFMDRGDNEKWMKALRDYMIENKYPTLFGAIMQIPVIPEDLYTMILLPGTRKICSSEACIMADRGRKVYRP